jgi:pterin-4a-carbinolamine dehydratase
MTLRERDDIWKLKEEALKSQSVKHSLWKRLWACPKADYVINHTFQRLNFSTCVKFSCRLIKFSHTKTSRHITSVDSDLSKE